MIGALLCLVASIPGGYNDMSIDDERAVNARLLFRQKVDTIFPEFRATNVLLQVLKAQYQIVAGHNVKLTCKLGKNEFETVIFFPLRKNPSITYVKPTANTISAVGGYHMVDPSEFSSDEVDEVLTTLRSQNEFGFKGTSKRLIMARTQVVAGSNTHIVFEDADGNLNSVVCYRNLDGARRITYFQQTK